MHLALFPYKIRIYDILTLFFLAFLSILSIIFHGRVEGWWLVVLSNLMVSAIILILVVKYSGGGKRGFMCVLRDWYPIVVIVYIFQVVGYLVHPIRGRDLDSLLILLDQRLFGLNPTEWIAQIHHPALTEFLQIVYASYYFLFLIAGYEIYRRKTYKEFNYYLLLLVLGFYLSYIGYLIVPAIGPRFTLHDFHSIYDEMPGLLLADGIRELLNMGESIPRGVPDPENYVHRDAFPSGHTQMTLVLIYSVWHYNLKNRKIITIIGILLIFSTVYLWYHYVIDLIAGGLFALATVRSAPYLRRFFERMLTNQEMKKKRHTLTGRCDNNASV
jgi:membrane-associated phospholipid phosphatase